MADRSLLTIISESIQEQIGGISELFDGEPPFGMKTATKRQVVSAMPDMNREDLLARSPSEREGHLKKVGKEVFTQQVRDTGMESMSSEQLQLLTPEQRQKHLQAIGREAFMEQIRGEANAPRARPPV